MMIISLLVISSIIYIAYLFCPQWNMWLYKTRKQTTRNTCCLTFDDGPSPDWTPQVLDILKQSGVSSTFFILGDRAQKYPDIVKRIIAEGHEIGNHTMGHRKLTFCTKNRAFEEISNCNYVLKSITGRTPSIFRAPHGFKHPSLNKLLSEMGLMLIPWTKGLWDTDMPSKEVLLSRLCKKFGKLEILLLHDGLDNRKISQNRKSMVEALPQIIKEYTQRDYRFMTISELVSKTL